MLGGNSRQALGELPGSLLRLLPMDDHEHDEHGHDRGLGYDLAKLVSRRRLLTLAAGAGAAAALAACGRGSSPSAANDSGNEATTTTSTSSSAEASATSPVSCAAIPQETAGPYPADGSNGPNALAESGIVRNDIRSSVGSSSGVAAGVPLAIELVLTDTSGGCTPFVGAAVYAWHCDREGGYSMYSSGIEDENYLRGVQESDADGRLAFTSIFPGCYAGRWPHVHFEVYASVEDATGGGRPLATSQLAFPENVCADVYATTGYEQSVGNLAGVSLASDNVFADGVDQQLAVVTGDPTEGYTATLAVAV